jgi:hypothetical protein
VLAFRVAEMGTVFHEFAVRVPAAELATRVPGFPPLSA